MKVLVTGGTGVVGAAAVDSLLRRGHDVRLLSRHATTEAKNWNGVDAVDATISDPSQVEGVAEGCDAILHIAGIVEEDPPHSTFQAINVEGTRNIANEAARAGVRRMVFVSSLGAERGTSAYHRSKVAAEEIVRAFGGEWLICRIGNVYGTGDEVVSVLLKWMRATPVMPVVGSGEDPFQPMWSGDAGEALAHCIERTDLAGRTLEIAGPDRTSLNDLLDRLSRITGREPPRVPIPTAIISAGARLAGIAGVKLPVNESHLAMLREHSVIDPPENNALETVLHLVPTSLDVGLRKLADALPEQLPDKGYGDITRRRFWADISGSKLSPEGLFARFRLKFSELTPWTMDLSTEEGAPRTLTAGATLTMALPFRGNIQVRVVEVSETRLTLVTVAGHPIAGGVSFHVEQDGTTIRFQATVYDRAANFADWLVMSTVGRPMQRSSWHELIENIVRESGGDAPDGVQEETAVLDSAEGEKVNAWLGELVADNKRSGKKISRPALTQEPGR